MLNDPPTKKTFQNMITDLDRIGGEPRCSALIIHLYVEYVVDWIIRKKNSKPDDLLANRYADKLDWLDNQKLLPEDLLMDLAAVGQIRNMYAHELDIESEPFQEYLNAYLNSFKTYIKQFPKNSTIGAKMSLISLQLIETLRTEYEKL